MDGYELKKKTIINTGSFLLQLKKKVIRTPL